MLGYNGECKYDPSTMAVFWNIGQWALLVINFKTIRQSVVLLEDNYKASKCLVKCLQQLQQWFRFTNNYSNCRMTAGPLSLYRMFMAFLTPRSGFNAFLWMFFYDHCKVYAFNTSRPRQNGHQFSRRHFQMHFHERNILYFASSFI